MTTKPIPSQQNDTATNRRHFLKNTTLQLAGGALGASAISCGAWNSVVAATSRSHPLQDDSKASTDKETRAVIFSSNKGNGFGKTKAEMVKNLQKFKDLGYDGMESVSPGIVDTTALRAASEEVEFPLHGVVDMVHWKKTLSSPDEKVRDAGRGALEQAIRDSRAIGGTSVLLVPGRVSGENENHDHVWKRSIVEIRKVLPLASRLGIHILIENVWNGFCENPEQLRDYIDEIGSPWVGSYFDIGNCRKFGPAEDWIRTLNQRIVKLDIKDWGKENSFCRLGEGDVNWPEVRKALVEIGFSGWATREGGDKNHEDTVQLISELLK